jgi:hypothetical protein
VSWHLHRDPDWQMAGANAYYQCRCGARRTRHVALRLMSPVRPGWPSLMDRHGRLLLDSGWRR